MRDELMNKNVSCYRYLAKRGKNYMLLQMSLDQV